MYVVDALDQHLIALLRADGRAPVSQLAAALHVSRGTAQNRLDLLIAEGVILGFTVRVRQDIDERHIRALMTIQLTGKTTTAVNVAADVCTTPPGTSTSEATCASSSPTSTVPRCVSATDAGSRPAASQWPRSTVALCRTAAASPNTLDASAYRAASRSVRRSPPPPTSSGIRGCSGRG